MKAIVMMGSPRDAEKMQGAADMLDRFGIEHEVHVLSAHRNPAEVQALASTARQNGFGAIVCGAGMAAHLAGAVAAQTTLPVIGVPLSGGISDGLDALLSTVQMPRGIPVATVAVNGSANAGILVAEMFSVFDSAVADALALFREQGAR